MIRIILDPQGFDKSIDGATIDCQGNAIEIAADFGLAIGDIYNGMKNRDPRMAKLFRSAIQAVVVDISCGDMLVGFADKAHQPIADKVCSAVFHHNGRYTVLFAETGCPHTVKIKFCLYNCKVKVF